MTKANQKPEPNKIKDLLFSHPFVEPKITGTITTSIKDKKIKAKIEA
jgi:hypothetical protein